ncbi:MAG: hypothetical protein KME02_15735 [Aphanothece saxicola GSE-SYN-MK-01-06B]|jgi:hypothetical protein|nr:hypothetical protein [Aphanothece saxicola GSE-SYN-MK-01-06B]
MRAPLALFTAGLLAFGLPAGDALAQSGIESRRVSFPAGAESALLKGQIKGDQTVDYKLRAGAGQTLTVDLKGSNSQNFFNVMAAATDTALFIGSVSGNRFKGLLPSDGDVTARVYLMRPAARRNETSTYASRSALPVPRSPPCPPPVMP